MMSARIGSWWLSSTDALPGEEVRFSKAANRTQSSGRAVGGKLFVTNYRIIFLPHLADAALSGEKLLLPLEQIRDIGQQPAGGDSLGGGLRDRLMIVHAGGAELFVANGLPAIIETMRQLCLPVNATPGFPAPAPIHPTAPAASRRGRWLRIALIGAVAVGFTGYRVYRDVHPSHEFRPVSSASRGVDATCPVEGAETLTMTKNSPAEPAIHIPVLPGWKEHDFRNDPKITSSPLFSYLRGIIANPDARTDDYTPSIEVVLEEGDDAATPPRQIVDTVLDDVKKKADSVQESTETICGTKIYRADFSGLKNNDTSESGMMLVAITDVRNGSRWIAGMRLLTSSTDNPDYLAERDAVLKGFRVSQP